MLNNCVPKQKDHPSAAQTQLSKRTPSLITRAFAGHLVPQDPTDEPAEKLLERIKSKLPAHAK